MYFIFSWITYPLFYCIVFCLFLMKLYFYQKNFWWFMLLWLVHNNQLGSPGHSGKLRFLLRWRYSRGLLASYCKIVDRIVLYYSLIFVWCATTVGRHTIASFVIVRWLGDYGVGLLTFSTYLWLPLLWIVFFVQALEVLRLEWKLNRHGNVHFFTCL